MADYTALTVVKNLPKGIHSGNRYIKTYPATPENAAWGDAYRAKYNEYPTNWSWQNATAVMLLAEAVEEGQLQPTARRSRKHSRGLTIKSPVRRRRHGHRCVPRTVLWSAMRSAGARTIPQEPYVPQVKAGDWKTIFELEAEWKKSKGYT